MPITIGNRLDVSVIFFHFTVLIWVMAAPDESCFLPSTTSIALLFIF